MPPMWPISRLHPFLTQGPIQCRYAREWSAAAAGPVLEVTPGGDEVVVGVAEDQQGGVGRAARDLLVDPLGDHRRGALPSDMPASSPWSRREVGDDRLDRQRPLVDRRCASAPLQRRQWAANMPNTRATDALAELERAARRAVSVRPPCHSPDRAPSGAASRRHDTERLDASGPACLASPRAEQQRGPGPLAPLVRTAACRGCRLQRNRGLHEAPREADHAQRLARGRSRNRRPHAGLASPPPRRGVVRA